MSDVTEVRNGSFHAYALDGNDGQFVHEVEITVTTVSRYRIRVFAQDNNASAEEVARAVIASGIAEPNVEDVFEAYTVN